MWPVGQLPGTSANKSDPVVTEEVSMTACSIPKSSVAPSPRPPGQSLCRGAQGRASASAGSRGEVSYCRFMMGATSKTENALRRGR